MAQINLQQDSRSFNIPTNILSRDLMSPTSDALTCFTQQQFSNKLQGYLVNYVISVSSYYSVYGK
jgi:hypothetical protein